jgi:hypothetical protein
VRRRRPASTPPADLAAQLAALGQRPAGSEGERLAHRRLADELRALGRTVRTDTFWSRPNAAAVGALCATAGLAGSVVAVDHPQTGLWIALAALLGLLADAAGVGPLRLLTRERASQNVVSAARGAKPVTLLVTAPVAAPRRGVLAGIPGALRMAVVGLFGVCAMCAVRAAEVEGGWIGAAQLVPTVLLIVAIAAFLDAASAPADEATGAASAPAAALAVVRELDARPLQRLAVEVVLSGAGARGVREHVRALRRAGVRATEVCVLDLGDCGAGPPRFWTREGELLALAYHPRLVALARRLAADERHLGARATATATMSGAWAARVRGWPAIRLGTRRQGGELDPDALARVVELAVGLVQRLDADLAGLDARPAPPPRRRTERLLRR